MVRPDQTAEAAPSQGVIGQSPRCTARTDFWGGLDITYDQARIAVFGMRVSRNHEQNTTPRIRARPGANRLVFYLAQPGVALTAATEYHGTQTPPSGSPGRKRVTLLGLASAVFAPEALAVAQKILPAGLGCRPGIH